MAITLSTGVSSGINYDEILGKLLAIEQRPIALLQQRKGDLVGKSTELSNLSVQVSDLKAKASALANLANFNNKTVTVTKSTQGVDLVSASATSDAAVGQYQVMVSQLAQAHSIAAQGFVDQNTTAVAGSSGTFKFRVGPAGKETSVAVSTRMTLVQLRDAINAAGGDATAAIVNDGSGSNPYRLVLTAKNAGAANTISITSNPTDLDFTNKKVEAAYAATTNSFTGTVSSNAGNTYTGTTNKTFLVKIVTAGAAGAATYKYSTDGGVTWLGSNGAAYNGSNAITTQGALTNYIDGAAASNSTNEGVQIAFGAGTLASGDTFTVDVFNPTLQSAQDAVLTVGNLTLSSASNTVTNAIQGVTLKLLKADSTETVDLTVSTDSTDIKGRVKDFVNAYNKAIQYLNDQLSFDPKNGQAKPLLGDLTATSLKRQLQGLITSVVPGASAGLNSLSTIGITSSKTTGQLTLNESKLEAALAKSVTDVTRLFVGLGVPSHSAIEYVGKTADTKPGVYAVEVTTAPTKATVVANTAVPSGGITQAETLTVSLYSNATVATDSPVSTSVSLSAGSTISDIVNALNSAFATKGMALSASSSGGKIKLTATNYGDDYKIVAFSNRADDGNQSGIGTTALSGTGVDVAGRLGSHKAEGKGEVLTSSSGFGESGLSVKAPVSSAGTYGTVTVSAGVADRMASLLEAATKDKGAIQTRLDGLSKSIEDLDQRAT
ncbi:flagellar filament capping protein FliD [Nitrospira sp. Kam-Ns4a]